MQNDKVWERFISQLAQVDFDYRCYSKRLAELEIGDKWIELTLQICTPGSGVGVIIAEYTRNAFVDVAWKIVLGVVSILALIRPWMFTEKIKNFQSAVQSLSAALSHFKIVLDDSHYDGIESKEWIENARKATHEINALVIPHQTFSSRIEALAQKESNAAYGKYWSKTDGHQG